MISACEAGKARIKVFMLAGLLNLPMVPVSSPVVDKRTEELLGEKHAAIYRATDRMFAVLLAVEWVAGIAWAWLRSPFTWDGALRSIHPHVWQAAILGAVVVSLPVFMAVQFPGRALTRQVVAIGQMFFSALLIHVSGGRFETHFHVFGSLAFLAFYRDWRILVTASVVVAMDHLVRNFYFPVSIYGMANPGQWRWLEHTGWVIFEDVFLAAAIRRAVAEMRHGAYKHALLEHSHQVIEDKVRQRTDQLRQMAMTDKLTGLPNRVCFMEHLREAVARSAEEAGYNFAVLFLDFDRFKIINDSLGHEAGDRLLVAIAGRLKRALLDSENKAAGRTCVAARLGGDEFVVLQQGISGSVDAIQLAESLLAKFSMPYAIQQMEVHSTASIGIATSEIHYTTADEILRDADSAMYRAKSLGRARYALFDPGMHEEAVHRMTLENDLRKAIAQKELSLAFQPIVKLDDGHLIGFEALLRWNHPQRGKISPVDFIPIAEETGMIVEIGEWVLERALAQMMEWDKRLPEARKLEISVNCSRRQLADLRFTSMVKDLLKKTGFEPGRLNLEITESIMTQDLTEMAALLKRLADLGVRLHMDDFGTGYSSLHCLHMLPMHVLKIDKSFVRNIAARRDYAAVIDAIIVLAHSLNITVIAEGVEKPEHVATLASLDCDAAQGYLFAQPMDPVKAEEYMVSHAPVGEKLATAAIEGAKGGGDRD